MEKGVLYRKIDKNRKDRNRNQGGYTLVELIVVICIVLILAGGAVFGVMTWIRWSQFKAIPISCKSGQSHSKNISGICSNTIADKTGRIIVQADSLISLSDTS